MPATGGGATAMAATAMAVPRLGPLWPLMALCQITFCAVLFVVALWNRADHYIFMLWFVLLSSSFFLA